MPISSITATANGSSSPGRTPGALHVDPAAVEVAQDVLRHGRADRVVRAGEQDAARQLAHQPRMCSTQTSVNRRRAVSWSMLDPPVERLAQEVGALVVQAAPGHVDGLDPRRRGALDRLEIAVADHEIVLDHPPERPHGQHDLGGSADPVGPLTSNTRLLSRKDSTNAIGAVEAVDEPEVLPSSRSKMATLRSCSTSGSSARCSSGRARGRRSGAPSSLKRRCPSRRSTARACASSPSARASVAAAGPRRAKLLPVAAEQRGALEEVVDGEPGGEAGGAAGRQDVVRPADIVADHLGRVGPEEDRAGVPDLPGQRLRPRADQLEMLRRQRIDQLGRLLDPPDHGSRRHRRASSRPRCPLAAAGGAAPPPPPRWPRGTARRR